MIEILYDAWGWLASVSIVVTLITGLAALRQWFSKDEDRSIAVKLLIDLLFSSSIVVLLLSFAIGTMFTRVPSVYNKTVSEAEKVLQDAGLNLSLPSGTTKDAEILDKIVTGQNYVPNRFVPKGTEIIVNIDSTIKPPTQEFVNVPKLVGERYIDALDILSESDLRYHISVVGEKDVSIEDAYIASQSIAVGLSVPKGSLIELELSTQEENIPSVPPSANMIEVPYVVDMEEKEAVSVLEERGLTGQVWWVTGSNESLAQYYIVSQSIPAGSMVPVGTLIELERSGVKPGTPVNVPNVVGMEQHEAITLLSNIGLQFQVWWTEENNISSEYYYIIGQSIPADNSVPAGTLVRLELSPIKP